MLIFEQCMLRAKRALILSKHDRSAALLISIAYSITYKLLASYGSITIGNDANGSWLAQYAGWQSHIGDAATEIILGHIQQSVNVAVRPESDACGRPINILGDVAQSAFGVALEQIVALATYQQQ